MIFVTLGTQKFEFNRLLKMIDQLVAEGHIQDEIFAQTGCSKYKPNNYASAEFLNPTEFHKMISKAEVVITHAGVGTIMECLEKGKKVIVVPRNAKYKEHVDNHQYEIAKSFSAKNYLLLAENYNELKEAILKSVDFQIKRYEGDGNTIGERIERFLDRGTKLNVLMVGSDLSVKGGIVSVLNNYLSYDSWSISNITYIPTHIEGDTKKKVVFFLKALFKIKRILKEGKIKLVHIHVSERGSFIRKSIILRMAKKHGCKAILHHHGAEFENYYDDAKSSLQKYIVRILDMVDMNIVLSKKAVSVIKKIARHAEVQVLYNAVPVSSTNKYNADVKEFTMLGRLEERKGTFELLEVIKDIDDELEAEIKFNLCGDGNIEKVKQTINKFEIGHRIGHVGWASGAEKENILNKTMAHVLFSYNEGLPMAILETMACGIVNISTNVAAIPEVIIDRETGFLVEPGDKQALAKVLVRVSKDKEIREIISKNAYNLTKEKFSISNNICDLEKLYQQLCEK